MSPHQFRKSTVCIVLFLICVSVRLCSCGGFHQFCGLLSLRPSGGWKKHQHPVVDAAAVRAPSDLPGSADSASCLCCHCGGFVLQTPGVPGVSGSGSVEVRAAGMWTVGGVGGQREQNLSCVFLWLCVKTWAHLSKFVKCGFLFLIHISVPLFNKASLAYM